MTRARAAVSAPTAWGWGVAVAVPLLFLGVFFAWPVVALVGRGFTGDAGGVDLGEVRDVLGNPRTWRLVGTTLAQAGAGAVGSVALGLPVAYLLYRTRFPGRGVLRGLVTVPFVLPTVVVGVAFRSLFRADGLLGWARLEETFAAVVVALVFFNVSVVVRTVGGLWERLDPRVEQAARALGASPARAFRTVTLPALAPAIASAAAVVFLFCATAFGVVLVLGGLGYGTVETEIYRRTTQFLDLRTAAVLSILQLLVVTLALWVAGRARARRERALHLVPDDVAAHRWSHRNLPDVAAAAATVLVVGGLIVLPLAGLVGRSFRGPDGSWGLANYRALGTTGGHNALVVTVWEALATSLRTALLATVIAVVVGGLVALVVSRRPRARATRRAVGLLDAVVMLPLGVSAVTVGFGFLITLDRPLGLNVDLRTSGLLVPIAQAVVAVPLVVRTVLPVLRAIDPRLRQAAGVLGASPGRVLRDVDLPIALRSLGLAVGFAFAVSLGEFGATAFLARPDSATLPVVIFRLIGRPGAENYGMALAASVVLAVLTAVVMMLAESLRGNRASGAAGGEF
ncbi:binding-protein-dependent transport systems inner membrane component [Xylanimonas cellulosilytica DSM 15894]|uniref:Binding-protein-dependent transport systems inner membrane component n=1 Tax=Xylanimonas cellulosilytica (strain DSM 15894 / JCM 12276 / CECT 5975 / KCTC 9989 / LMG 20990 / NBRC 107835 / XIL07) TaxID=446471 RepID=D1BU54_XYLCX|nr:iron ABC transporter permease [Xylanimonas cellulosilytica]ACZ29218.1 binding-protein-dependent transport systems inner membrane component [Xylanimonas cellulosilytica DSM 15894]